MRRVVLFLVVSVLALGGCTFASGQPGVPTVGDAAQQLDALTVATPHAMSGYARDRFPHWRRVDDRCDVRDVVLQRDGTGVRVSKTCQVQSGRWFSVFDEQTLVDPDDVDIDHLVPLANAWRSGADRWTDDRRSDFANDLDRPQLKAVSRLVNRSKGDQDPSQWRPPAVGYWCDYARSWIAVKSYWQLTITNREKIALREMLGSCRQNSGSPTS